MDIAKNLIQVTKLIGWLNLRKVFLTALAGLVSLALFTGYEQRVRIFAPPIEIGQSPPKFTVSADMQEKIKVIIERSELIAGVSVLTVDLRTNEREVVFSYHDDKVVAEAFRKYYAEHGFIQPIFTKDDDSNSVMISVINGEFSCGKNLASTAGKEHAICRISLPPYYGEFAGYILFALNSDPTEVDKHEIELEARRLANELFFKNIVKK